jgi:hypothetical protein
MICIYEHRPGPGGATLGGGGASVENWRTRLVLRGHANNVVDLGWSPDDSRLASASLDNAVCIWDASSGQRLHTLDYHTSFVKGLAWDPVGTYLATQVGGGGGLQGNSEARKRGRRRGPSSARQPCALRRACMGRPSRRSCLSCGGWQPMLAALR